VKDMVRPMQCHAAPCRAVLCCAVLCYAAFHYVISYACMQAGRQACLHLQVAHIGCANMVKVPVFLLCVPAHLLVFYLPCIPPLILTSAL
jgi:hypothetical protein